jgi:acetyl esterase
MPVDPQVQVILDALASLEAPEFAEQTPDQVREAYRAFSMAGAGEPEVGSVEDRTIPGPAGPLPVRVYRPSGEGTAGGLVYYHGGGWVIGDLDSHDSLCRQLCAGAGVVVVSVDYRLAPEHPYPAASDDAWAALEWVAANADELGIDRDRLAVGGDSAGGNLAALMAVRCRDAGGPPLRLQLLIYPATDLVMGHPSITENGEGYFLTADSMRWFARHYLGVDREHGDPADAAVSPLHAASLAGVAPARVVTAEFDPLRDEGNAYAARLADQGFEVELDENPGMIHGFFQMGAMAPSCAAAVGRAVDHVKRTIG